MLDQQQHYYITHLHMVHDQAVGDPNRMLTVLGCRQAQLPFSSIPPTARLSVFHNAQLQNQIMLVVWETYWDVIKDRHRI